MKKSLIYILLALAASACIYPFDVEQAGEVPKRLVISGDILIGDETQITLGYVLPLNMTPNDMAKYAPPSASVTVENDKGQSFEGKKQKDGTYTVDTGKAPDNARYRLVVKLFDGREYNTPWAGVNDAPEITDLSYTIDEDDLYLQCSMNGRDSLWNFCWSYEEVWEYHAYYAPDILYQRGEYVMSYHYMDYYYCWNSRNSREPVRASAEGLSENRIDNNNFLTIRRSDYRLSYLYSINIIARGLSSDARKYHDHQVLGSNGTGDLFTPTPSEMRGNIRCVTDPDEQVVGYISVCKCSSCRIFIKALDIYIQRENPASLLFYPEPDSMGAYHLDVLYRDFSPVYCDGLAPNETNVVWGPKRCTDCLAWGGTKKKPQWWPNDDE